MSKHHDDNYVRCHQALQLVSSASIHCIQDVLNTWHQRQQQLLVACSTPQTCPNKGKPKTVKGSCQACVAWGHAIESVTYPPNSSGSSAWANINPTLLHKDSIEVAKAFVLRLPAGQVYQRLGDFDAASLLMIMMRFREFHQGCQQHYEVIKKIFGLRNDLSHLEVQKNLTIEEVTLQNNFRAIEDFFDFLNICYPSHIPKDAHTNLLAELKSIGESPVTQALKDNVLLPFTDAMEKVVRETIQDVLTSDSRRAVTSEAETSTDVSDFFSIDLCRQELCDTYKNDKATVSLFPFDIDGIVKIDDIYVNLELLEHKQKPDRVVKTKLQLYGDLFCLKNKKVLVKGGPGSGKTTLSTKIAYDWAETKTGSSSGLGQVQLLFYLNMRNLDQDMSLVDGVFDQLLPHDSQITRHGLECYIRENSAKIAILLDGADEFSGRIVKSTVGDRIVDIICNKILSKSIVIVTTRPHRSQEFTQYTNVEITGFSDAGQVKFAERFFQVRLYSDQTKENIKFFSDTDTSDTDTSEDDEQIYHSDPKKENVKNFRRTIRRSNYLSSMSCVPVILTMLALLWKESSKLPARMTSLYHEAIHYLTQRWLEKRGDDTDSDEMERDQLRELGKAALNGLFEDRLFFQAHEFPSDGTLHTACAVGLVSQEKKRSKLHATKHYTFFHKSFQEYCAAAYWVSLGESDFLSFLTRINNTNLDSFEYVLLFSCGLSQMKALCILKYLRTCGVTSEVQIFPEEFWQFGLKLLFESDSYRLVGLLYPLLNTRHFCINIRNDLHPNMYVLLDYFFSCLKKYIMFGNSDGFPVAHLPINTIEVPVTYQQYFDDYTGRNTLIQTDMYRTGVMLTLMMKISGLMARVIEFNITDRAKETLHMTAKLLGAMRDVQLYHLTKILIDFPVFPSLVYNYLDCELEALGKRIGQLKSLQDLSLLSPAPVDISPVFAAMTNMEMNSIVHFECIEGNYSADSIQTFLSMQRDLRSLSITLPISIVQDKEMLSLNIQKFTVRHLLSDQNIAEILRSINPPLCIKLLSLRLGSIAAVVLKRFMPRCLTMHLSNNLMNKQTSEQLFEAMCEAKTMRELQITRNEIGGEVVTVSGSPVYIPIKSALVNRISRNDVQKFVWLPTALGLCSLGPYFETNAVGKLVNSFKGMPYLEHLTLSNVELIPENISVIAGGLHHTTFLEKLDLSDNCIHGACGDLRFGLTKLKLLSSLNLNNTGLVDTDAIALSGSFQYLPSLTSLQLDRNVITCKGTYALCRSFQHISKLSVLSLSDNPIGVLGTLALCKYMRNLPCLSSIDLQQCSLDSSAALLLAISFRFAPNLTNIYLDRNTLVGPDGIAWLFESINKLNELEELSLGGIHLKYTSCNEKLKTCFQHFGWKSSGEDSVRRIQLKSLDLSAIRSVIDVFSVT